jgi:hypothetical protein
VMRKGRLVAQMRPSDLADPETVKEQLEI